MTHNVPSIPEPVYPIARALNAIEDAGVDDPIARLAEALRIDGHVVFSALARESEARSLELTYLAACIAEQASKSK